MNRRELFPILPAIAVATASERLREAPTKQQLILTAPGDVNVQKLFVSNAHVKKGDPLATLSSIQLDRYKALLELQSQSLAIEERPFQDGRVGALLQLTQDEVNNAQHAATTADDYAIQLANGAILGRVDQPDVPPARIEALDRRSELATVQNELDNLPKEIADAKDRIANAKQQIAVQKAALDKLAALLQIVAPADGLFIASAGEGGFIKRGDQIGVLYL